MNKNKLNFNIVLYKIKDSLIKASKNLWGSVPILLGVMLLVSLSSVLFFDSVYSFLFRGNLLIDSFIGSILGSIFAGNPITSYVLGGEFLKQGISLLAVTSFLVSWVTVGLVQFPAESLLLGKKFAITRNLLAFFFSIIVAIIVVVGVSLF